MSFTCVLDHSLTARRRFGSAGAMVLRLSLLLFALALVSPGYAQAAPPIRPNIVVLLADDMGVGDIQALHPAGKIRTPHLDRLVAQGMHFTDAHSASAVCTPTRYGLLTGRYAWRSPLQYHVLLSYVPSLLRAETLTLPEHLKAQGYRAGLIGKWHLGFGWTPKAGGGWDYAAPLGGGPLDHGFDHYFGVDFPNLEPYTFIEGRSVAPLPTETLSDPHAPWVPAGPKIGYAPSREVLPFLPPGPMAPGWKFEEILPTLTRKACEYVEAQAKSKEPFFLLYALTSPHVPITPSARFLGKSGIHPYADFVMETDWAVGEIMSALDRAGITENTLVLFAADNGHDDRAYGKEMRQAGHIGSGPYRGNKGMIWEGGHRVPFIVRWPGVVPAGSSASQLVCLNDLFATVADLTSSKLPETAAPDSVSLLPILKGDRTAVARRSLVHHDVRGRFAIRDEHWKLILFPEENGQPAKRQLYDLSRDIAETADVSGQNADIVARLEAELMRQIRNGRSTPGPQLPNDRPVDPWSLPTERIYTANADSAPVPAVPANQ